MILRFVIVFLFSFFSSINIVFAQATSRLENKSFDMPITQKHIILMYSNATDLILYRQSSDAFLSKLEKAGVPAINIHYEFLELINNGTKNYKIQIAKSLREKYQDLNISAIVVMGYKAQNFVTTPEYQLFPQTPIISVLSFKQFEVPMPIASARSITEIVVQSDLVGTLEQALNFFPNTKHVYFVIGASEEEKQWLLEAKKVFLPWNKSIEFEYTNNYTYHEMLEKVPKLSKNSIVFYTTFYADKTGQPFLSISTATEVINAARVPVFGVNDVLLGTGIIGGSLINCQLEGNRAADLLLDILRNKSISMQPLQIVTSVPIYMFDWKQLEHWRIDKQIIPPNSIIINQPLNLWSHYKGWIIIVIVILILQLVLIISLAVQKQQQKKTEAKLAESKEQFKILFDHAPDAICVFDYDLQLFVDANKKAEDLFDCTKQTLLQHGPRDVLFSDQPDNLPVEVSLKQYIEQALLGKEVVIERKIKSFKGECKIGDVRLVKLPAENKRLIRVNFIDKTEQKAIAERLRQSEKMEAIGQLAGGIAHDFNNQLTIIMGFAEIINLQSEDEKARWFAQNIKQASMRASDLTKNLLTFSRKGNLINVKVDINAIVSEVITLLQHSIDKKITLKKELDTNSLIVLGDPTQLQSGLINLALNARDALLNGGEIIIKTALCTLAQSSILLDLPAGKYIQVSVIDNGCGMSVEVQKRMFEPFFTTKELGKGTGLGLAAVYGMVKSHQGAITVNSTLGIGSNITIYLPLAGNNNDYSEKLELKTHLEKGCANILVVEDEELIANMLKEVLQKLGYVVTIASNGEEALEYYTVHWMQCDLVILDMIMPKMGGKAAFIGMRKINPKIKAILASGYSLYGEAQSIIDEGVLAFIQKPFQIEELTKKVSEILKLKI